MTSNSLPELIEYVSIHEVKLLNVHISFQGEISNIFQFITFYIYFALVLVLLISNLWADVDALPGASRSRAGSGEREPLLGHSSPYTPKKVKVAEITTQT